LKGKAVFEKKLRFSAKIKGFIWSLYKTSILPLKIMYIYPVNGTL
jgi:hypothetical protein